MTALGEKALGILADRKEARREELKAFAEKVTTGNPLYAFEWADRPVLAAAEYEDLCLTENVVQHLDREDTDLELTWENIIAGMERSVRQRILEGARVSGSTSTSHRLTQTARAQTASRWLDLGLYASTLNPLR